MSYKKLTCLYKSFFTRLFNTPFSYIIAACFIFYVSISFFIGQKFFLGAGSTDLHNFFSVIASSMVVIIPAFTSSLNSFYRENNIPVKDIYAVIIRIVSLLTFCVFFIIFTFPIPLCVNFFGDIDVAQLLCGYFGIILYCTTAIASVVFLYTVINNNVIAFIVSLFFLLFINNCHKIASYISLQDFIISILKTFSFSWHFNSASKGIIDSRDIIFYLSACLLFIIMTWLNMEHKRGNKDPLLKRIFIVLLVSFVLVIVDSNRFYARFDTTKAKKFSISKYSKVLLSEINEPLKITYYCSSILKNIYPQVKDIDDFINTYADENSNIVYEIVDPGKKNIENVLEENGIKSLQIQTASDTTTSYTKVYSSIAINYLDKTEVIPFVVDTHTLEYDLTGRIQTLVRDIQKTVQIVIGNGLSLTEEYSFIQPWLEAQGFNVINTLLPSQKSKGNVIFSLFPNVPLIVIGTNEFTKEDVDALSYFIQRGGKLFIATTPYTIDLYNDWSVVESENLIKDNVVYMLQQYGIYFKDTLTADISNMSQIKYPLWPVLPKQDNAINGMNLFWPCSIDIDNAVSRDSGFEANYMLSTGESAWQMERIDGQFLTNPVTIEQSASESEEKGSFYICAELKKSGKTQCIIFGDQYGLSTNLISYNTSNNPDSRILDFLSDGLLKLCDQESLLNIKNKSSINTSLYKETAIGLELIILLVIILPLTIIIGSAIFAKIKRNRFNRSIIL